MINAIELRQQGLKAIGRALKDSDEGIIAFKGKPKYVVVPFEKHNELKALELDMAYIKTIQSIKDDKFTSLKTSDDIDIHIESLKQNHFCRH